MREAFDAFDSLALSPAAAWAVGVLAVGSLTLLVGAIFRRLR